VDRLIALLVLRLRLDVRAALGARSRLLGLAVALPALALVSLVASLVAASGARLLERVHPDLALPALSALAATFGLTWALSPLLAGLQATETHDLGKLLHYPVPLPTLVASSLLANVAQPMVLAQLPPLAALALGLAGPGLGFVLAASGLLLSLALALAAGQAVALGLHALSRHRRWSDRALSLGILLGLALSLVPLLYLGGGATARRLVLGLLRHDVFAAVPFAWGARAAVFGARGELGGYAVWAGLGAAATAGAVSVSVGIARRLYRGEIDLGAAASGAAREARIVLPGRVGALVEKDLRVVWRDPRLKAVVFGSVIGPLIVSVALWQGAGERLTPGVMMAVGSFAGLGVLGSNALALERQGLGMLFGFPVDRVLVLLGKNLGSMALRVPGTAVLAVATGLTVGPRFLPAVLTLILLTQLVASAVDNYLSILAPVPVPRAGADPGTSTSGARGLGAAALAFAALVVSLVASTPFAFLVWLPYLLGASALWVASLPLALGGAAGAYFLMTAHAARLLQAREPELVARAAGSE
jgi:ABC-2 type transport system permease protein